MTDPVMKRITDMTAWLTAQGGNWQYNFIQMLAIESYLAACPHKLLVCSPSVSICMHVHTLYVYGLHHVYADVSNLLDCRSTLLASHASD